MQSTPAQQRVTQTATTTTTTTTTTAPTQTEASSSGANKSSASTTGCTVATAGKCIVSSSSSPPPPHSKAAPDGHELAAHRGDSLSGSEQLAADSRQQQQRQVGSKQSRSSYTHLQQQTTAAASSNTNASLPPARDRGRVEAVVLQVTGEGGKSRTPSSSDSIDSAHNNNNNITNNNSSKIQQSSAAGTSVAKSLEQSVSQNNLVDQRIKVTLSAPRNNSIDFHEAESEQPILTIDDDDDDDDNNEGAIKQAGSDATARASCSSSGRRRSTATTLISAPICKQFSEPTSTAHGDTTSSQARYPLSRSEQENELRRIASQRLRKRPLEQPTVVSPTEGSAPAISLARDTPSGSYGSKPVSPQPQQQQQQNQLQPEANPKQLAIYINGKIRSNSIFCRSTSSNSFNGILNRFHSGGGNKLSSREQLDRAAENKQSPLRLCRTKSGKASSSSSSGATTCHQPAPKAGGHSRANLLRRNFGKLLINYLIPSSDKTQELCKPSSLASDTATGHGARDEQEDIKKFTTLSHSSSDLDGAAHEPGATTTTSYKLNPSSMFLRKAMRYYRLWIYCTNITILLGTLIFILSALYVLSDYRFKLLVSPPTSTPHTTKTHNTNSIQHSYSISDFSLASETAGSAARAAFGGEPRRPQDGDIAAGGRPPPIEPVRIDDDDDEYNIRISYTEPYVVLAYAVIAIQAGLLQAIGCFGAVRMKERWIQAFYYLILALIALDVMLLMGWLNRYDFIVKSLQDYMALRLRHHYGGGAANGSAASAHSHLAGGGASAEPLPQLSDNNIQELDKILTEIIDKIQTDSQCCGITDSLDYRNSNWRADKLARLTAQLNLTAAAAKSVAGQNSFANLMSRVPLVPASCCRRLATPAAANRPSGRRPPLDDSQIERPNRVPAWSPSLVVDNLHQRGHSGGSPARAASEHQPAAGEPVGGSREEAEHDPAQGQDDYGKLERRLLAKQDAFKLGAQEEDAATSGRERQRRWIVESTVDANERVLSRLVDADEQEVASGGPSGQANQERQHRRRQQQLAKLRRMLFVSSRSEPQQPAPHASGTDWWCTLDARACGLTAEHFRSPNKLQLSYGQYKTIESYLLSPEVDYAAAAAAIGRRTRRHHHNQGAYDETQQDECSGGSQDCTDKRTRIEKSTVAGLNMDMDPEIDAPSKRRQQQQTSNEERELLMLIRATLEADPEIGCAPRSYYDLRAIHTRGCYPDIKAWLDSSAHILFVTGFCILTVLKFCSLVLLRLEIREMIHKIRVLKGMATEYNALHDLEAYLPRPSLCAQAAELTASGVALAAAASGGAPAAGPQQQPAPQPPMHRLGGSFSEAVAAATAAAHGGGGASAGGLGPGLASSGRAASMKAVAAINQMLAPSLCPRSSSASAAHLQAAASLLGAGQAAGCSLRSDPCNGSLMSRRHTAVSVCPAAAAAVAAAAAQHLMSRRGTYVANPMFDGAGGAASTSPAAAANLGCFSASSNLFQHRHSAHTVHTLLSRPQSQQQQQQVAASRQHASKRSSRQYLGDVTPTAIDTGGDGPQNQQQRASAGSHHQLLSLVHPFKRQSSGGAQSACNFSLDLAPQLSAESRRSIH